MSFPVDHSLLNKLPPDVLLSILLGLDYATLQRLRLTSKRVARYAEIALSRYPLWFLPRNRIWFSDENCKGRLMLVNAHGSKKSIEGVQIEARQEHPQAFRWSHNPEVLIHVFEPHISLTSTVFKFDEDEDGKSISAPFLTQRLPKTSSQKKEELWPPSTIPSATRVRRGDIDETERHHISLTTRVPENFSCSTLKLPLSGSIPPSPGRAPSDSDTRTWSTLAPQLYRPTAKAPFNGIFVGDYAGHGPEFVLIMHQSSTILQQQINGKLHVEHSPPLPGHRMPHNGPAVSGSMVAVKLTGDESVPRGCLSFVADDLGTNGLVRVADEWPFKDAPIIRSKGVRSASSTGKYRFVPTQLILLSTDTIAHYWEESGHISFLQRVDIDKLLHRHGVDCV